MPPKADPNAELILYMRVKGGINLPITAIAPKIGPYGLPPKIVADKIFEATSAYKGVRVTIKLHSKNRQPTISIVPSASTLVLKALNEGPRTAPKGTAITHSGSLSYEQVVSIAKEMRGRSYAVDFAGTVREILGTAHSIGCNVVYEGTSYRPHDLIEKIKQGEIEIESYNVPFSVQDQSANA